MATFAIQTFCLLWLQMMPPIRSANMIYLWLSHTDIPKMILNRFWKSVRIHKPDFSKSSILEMNASIFSWYPVMFKCSGALKYRNYLIKPSLLDPNYVNASQDFSTTINHRNIWLGLPMTSPINLRTPVAVQTAAITESKICRSFFTFAIVLNIIYIRLLR